MDPMAQAFAYYNFDVATNTPVYTPGVTQAKYHINATNFPLGFNTPDDSWNNRWRAGPNMLAISANLPLTYPINNGSYSKRETAGIKP